MTASDFWFLIMLSCGMVFLITSILTNILSDRFQESKFFKKIKEKGEWTYKRGGMTAKIIGKIVYIDDKDKK